MGKEKTTTVVQSSGTTTPQPTEAELELQKLELERQRATQEGWIQTQTQGLNLINALLTGQTELPGFFGQLGAGISPEMIDQIAQESIKDLPAMFQQMGILEGGVAPEIMARTSGDIRRAIEEFNIGNRFNLLNLAFGGQAQVQQPLLAQSQLLSQRLAGLRPTSWTGQQTSTQYGMNPFMKSFQTSLGQTMGKGVGEALPFIGA